MHNRGSVVHNRSMVNQRSSMHRCLIIVGLSSISHFLDHPVPTIVVSHSLHPTIRQGNSVGARGGVAIPGLLLLEVCSAVAIVDPVLVRVDGGLAQVLVGELRCWRSQARADKGQQQGHLEGDEGGVAGGNGGWLGNNVMEKAERGQLFSRERVLRIGWIMKLFVGVADFFAKLLFSHRGSPSWWRHSQTGTGAGALRGSSYTLGSVSNQPLLSAGSPFSPTTQKQPRPLSPSNRTIVSLTRISPPPHVVVGVT